METKNRVSPVEIEPIKIPETAKLEPFFSKLKQAPENNNEIVNNRFKKITNDDFLLPKNYKKLLRDFSISKKIETIVFADVNLMSYDELKKIEIPMRKLNNLRELYFVNISLQNNQLLILKDYLFNNPSRIELLLFTSNNLTGYQLEALFLKELTLSHLKQLRNIIITDNRSLAYEFDIVERFFKSYSRAVTERQRKRSQNKEVIPLNLTFTNNTHEQLYFILEKEKIFKAGIEEIRQRFNQTPDKKQLHLDFKKKDLTTEQLHTISQNLILIEKSYDKFPFEVQSIKLCHNTNAETNAWEEFANYLEITKHLRSLSLRECDLSESEMEYLSSSLGKNRNLPLEKLDLSDNTELFSKSDGHFMSGWRRLFGDFLKPLAIPVNTKNIPKTKRPYDVESQTANKARFENKPSTIQIHTNIKCLILKNISLDRSKMKAFCDNLLELRLEKLVYYERLEDIDSLWPSGFETFSSAYLMSENAGKYLKSIKLKRLNSFPQMSEDPGNQADPASSPKNGKSNFNRSVTSKHMKQKMTIEGKQFEQGSHLNKIMEGLRNLRNLLFLDISNTTVYENETWKRLFNLLSHFTNLKSLKLKQNGLKDEWTVLKCLVISVKSLKNLTDINLARNRLLNNSLAKCIIGMIEESESLRIIRAPGCGLDLANVLNIFSGNFEKTKLELLDLIGNEPLSEEVCKPGVMPKFKENLESFLKSLKFNTKIAISNFTKMPFDPNNGLGDSLIQASTLKIPKIKENSLETGRLHGASFVNSRLVDKSKEKNERKLQTYDEFIESVNNNSTHVHDIDLMGKGFKDNNISTIKEKNDKMVSSSIFESDKNEVLRESQFRAGNLAAAPLSKPNEVKSIEMRKTEAASDILPSYIHQNLLKFWINNLYVIPDTDLDNEITNNKEVESQVKYDYDTIGEGFASAVLFLTKCSNLEKVYYHKTSLPTKCLNLLNDSLNKSILEELKQSDENKYLPTEVLLKSPENVYKGDDVLKEINKNAEMGSRNPSNIFIKSKPELSFIQISKLSLNLFKKLGDALKGKIILNLDLSDNNEIRAEDWTEFFSKLKASDDTYLREINLSRNQEIDGALETQEPDKIKEPQVPEKPSTNPATRKSLRAPTYKEDPKNIPMLIKLLLHFRLQSINLSFIKFSENSWINLCQKFVEVNPFLRSINVSITGNQLDTLTHSLRKNKFISIEKLTLSCYEYSSPEGWLEFGYDILRSSRTVKELALDHCDVSRKLNQIFYESFTVRNLKDYLNLFNKTVYSEQKNLHSLNEEPPNKLIHEEEDLIDKLESNTEGLYFSTCGLSIFNTMVTNLTSSPNPVIEKYLQLQHINLTKGFQQVEYCAFKRFVLNLKKFSHLERLDLSDNNLTYFFIQILLDFLPKIPKVQDKDPKGVVLELKGLELDLSRNNFTIDYSRLQREILKCFDFVKENIRINLFKIKSELTVYQICQSDIFKYRRPNFFDFSDLKINSMTLTPTLFEDFVSFLTGPCLDDNNLGFFLEEQKILAKMNNMDEKKIEGLKMIDFSGNNLDEKDALSILEKFQEIMKGSYSEKFKLQKLYFLRNEKLEEYLRGEKGVEYLNSLFDNFNNTSIDELYFDYSYSQDEFKLVEEKFIQFIRLLPPAEINLENKHSDKTIPFLSLNAIKALYVMMFGWPHIKYVTIYYDYKAFINQGIAFSLRERIYKRKWDSSIGKCFKAVVYKFLGLFIVPQAKFRFNPKALVLNDYLDNNYNFKYVSSLILLLIPIYYFCGIFGPIYFMNSCQEPIPITSVIIYVIFAGITGVIELLLYIKFKRFFRKEDNKRDKTPKPSKTKIEKLKFMFGEFLKILTSQLARYDLYTDVCFVIICYLCGEYVISLLSLIVLSLNFLIRFVKLIATLKRNYFNPYKRSLNTGNIAELIYTCSFVEFIALGDCLEEVSPYNVWKIPDWRCFGSLKSQTIDSDLLDHFLQFLFEDFPQFLLQIAYLTRGRITPIIIFNLVITILNSLNAINKFLSKVPSYVSQIQIDSLLKKKSEDEEEYFPGDKKNLFLRNTKHLFSQPSSKISKGEVGKISQEKASRGIALDVDDSEKLLLDNNSRSDILKEKWSFPSSQQQK